MLAAGGYHPKEHQHVLPLLVAMEPGMLWQRSSSSRGPSLHHPGQLLGERERVGRSDGRERKSRDGDGRG
jgi:hypothetical protein